MILWCLRWYGSTPMSYANVSDMLAERGVSVHRSTIYRWFIEYAPIKKLVKAGGGFKRPNLAGSTLQGVETLRRLNKGQFDIWLRRDEPERRVRERSAFMNRLFHIEAVLA
ncbi:hypothetical protein [Yersinia sp. 2541 StPb PI]|uniref:hypothetical protein n=1 Tax=Yersinia sp. 2541 StPb PI TaxID=3117407 RepID=UPI003FA44DA2